VLAREERPPAPPLPPPPPPPLSDATSSRDALAAVPTLGERSTDARLSRDGIERRPSSPDAAAAAVAAAEAAAAAAEAAKRSSKKSLRSDVRRMMRSGAPRSGSADVSMALSEAYRLARTSTEGELK